MAPKPNIAISDWCPIKPITGDWWHGNFVDNISYIINENFWIKTR
jgi:hypothetical protein